MMILTGHLKKFGKLRTEKLEHEKTEESEEIMQRGDNAKDQEN